MVQLFGAPRRQRDEYLFRCPFCDDLRKKKLSINLDKDKVKCWVCDYKAKHILDFIKKVSPAHVRSWKQLSGEGSTAIDFSASRTDAVKVSIVSLPKEYVFCGNLPERHPARKYLASRGITYEDIIKHKIGWTSTGDYPSRLIFPYFNAQGRCHFFTTRAIRKAGVSYVKCDADLKSIVLNELCLDFRRPITIVEGPVDAIKTGDMNTVPLLGSTLSTKAALFQAIVASGQDVYLGLDPDAKKKEYDIAQRFCLYGTTVYKIPVRPYKDIGVMNKEEYQEQRAQAYEFCGNDIKNRINQL